LVSTSSLVAHLFQWAGADDSGVGHHDVEAAEVGDGLRDRGVDRGRVTDVYCEGHAAPAQLVD
jgi:hypothetical protein